MKLINTLSVVLLWSLMSHAKVISSQEINIPLQKVDKVIHLSNKMAESGQKKISIVVLDNGLSTDFTPRYETYLRYSSSSEMGNLTAAFKLKDQVFEIKSAHKKTDTLFVLKTTEFINDEIYEVTQTIDTSKIKSDEISIRKKCGGEFCDVIMNTTIKTKEFINKN